MTWVPLDVSLLSDGLWSDLWASRLWLWLLCQAQTATVPGVVLFSYPVVARQLAVLDGRKRREPSRKVLRRALQKLASIGRLRVQEWEQGWEQARDRGGAQGYLTVRLMEWPPAGIGAGTSGTGSTETRGTGSGRDRAAKGHTKKREREEGRNPTDSLSESGADSDVVAKFRGLWNQEVAGFNVRRLNRRTRDTTTSKRIRAFLRDCGGEWALLEASVSAYVRRDFHQDRDTANRLGVDTFLRPAHRSDYLERGRDFLTEGAATAGADTDDRRVRAAEDLGCAPSDLTYDPATGEYRKPAEQRRNE